MAITTTTLSENNNYGLRLTAPDLFADVLTLDLSTGACASPYFPAKVLSDLQTAALNVFQIVPYAERAGGALNLLGRLLTITVADDAVLTLSAVVVGDSATLRATINAAPGSLVLHVPYSGSGGIAFSVGSEATGGGGGGGVTAVTASLPLASSGGAAPDISLNDSGVVAATYGSATSVAVVTVSAKGIVTGAVDTPITFPAAVTSVAASSPLSSSGGATPTISLDNSGVVAATYGSATSVPVVTVDAKGLVTGVTDTAITFPPGGVTSVTASAPLASSGGATPDISLNNSGVVAASYGSATSVAVVTVDAKGIVTGAVDTPITFPASVTSVTASSPLASSGGATPDISITAGTTPGDVLTWNGAAWAGAAVPGGTVTLQDAYDDSTPATITLANAKPLTVTPAGGATAGISLNATNASNFTVTGTDLTLATNAAGNVNVNAAGDVTVQGGQAFFRAMTGSAHVYINSPQKFNIRNVTIGSDVAEIDSTGAIRFNGDFRPNNAPGTAGQVLTSAGPGTPPVWAAAGGGSTVTFAQQFYVAKNGNDGTGDGSLSKPYLTIGAALTAAGAVADTEYVRINVSPGTYTENLTITRRRTVLWGSGSAPQTPVTTVAGTITINPATATDRFNDLIAFYGLVLTSLAGSTSAAVGCTGTQLYAVVITSCYVATANAGFAALSCDNSNASRCTITLRQTTVARTVGTGTANVCDFTRGDVRFDTVLVQATATGAYSGINLANNATLNAENTIVDVSGAAPAINVTGAYASGAKLQWNSGTVYSRNNAAGAPALYLSNTSSVAALLTNTQLMTEYTGAGLVTIDGVFTSPFPTFYFSNLTFYPNSSSVTNSTVAAALAAVAQRLTTYGILPATNGGTGQSSYTTGDLLYASSATALSKLTAGAAGTALLSAGPGVAPAWGPLPYSAATPAQWATSAPTTVKAALDRLASAVYALRGSSPIP